jgi:thioredoxin 1
MVAPILNEIAEEYSESIKIAKLNIDENQQYAAQLGVTSIPTMAVFKNGQLDDRIIGAMPKQAILARLQPHMAASTTGD